MLIYLQPLAQRKVLSLFHFALKTAGALFLGPSETTGELADEFDIVNAPWRLYKKRRDIRLPFDMRLPTGTGSAGSAKRPLQTVVSKNAFPIRTAITSVASIDRELLGVYDTLLADYMPTALLLNESSELVHSFR